MERGRRKSEREEISKRARESGRVSVAYFARIFREASRPLEIQSADVSKRRSETLKTQLATSARVPTRSTAERRMLYLGQPESHQRDVWVCASCTHVRACVYRSGYGRTDRGTVTERQGIERESHPDPTTSGVPETAPVSASTAIPPGSRWVGQVSASPWHSI